MRHLKESERYQDDVNDMPCCTGQVPMHVKFAYGVRRFICDKTGVQGHTVALPPLTHMKPPLLLNTLPPLTYMKPPLMLNTLPPSGTVNI